MAWDPLLYRNYVDERSRPFADLVARIGAEAPAQVVDLGCGSGGLTSTLAQRWPDARIVGLDSSPEMLGAAVPGPRLSFQLQDIAEWDPSAAAPDVIVSNAALQWVPGHLAMLERWARALRTGGWLAFQVPANFSSPSHRLMRETAELPEFRDRLAGVLRHDDAIESIADYWKVLAAAGCVVDAWETTYLHVLLGDDPVLEWVRGTGLRPVLATLDAASAARFEAEYAARLREAYPSQGGATLFPFARRFVVARSGTS
ncbi:MAG: tam [Pseudonocardiales bacterium]|nr:tam [Pseudonocardiales bacterium]